MKFESAEMLQCRITGIERDWEVGAIEEWFQSFGVENASWKAEADAEGNCTYEFQFTVPKSQEMAAIGWFGTYLAEGRGKVHTYRLTRAHMYTANCAGRANPSARQGHYVKARSLMEAKTIMMIRYPMDPVDSHEGKIWTRNLPEGIQVDTE